MKIGRAFLNTQPLNLMRWSEARHPVIILPSCEHCVEILPSISIMTSWLEYCGFALDNWTRAKQRSVYASFLIEHSHSCICTYQNTSENLHLWLHIFKHALIMLRLASGECSSTWYLSANLKEEIDRVSISPHTCTLATNHPANERDVTNSRTATTERHSHIMNLAKLETVFIHMGIISNSR